VCNKAPIREFNAGVLASFKQTHKSGNNKFHGGVFEFIRNDKLDARNYFSLTRAILKPKPVSGVTWGPISDSHLLQRTGQNILPGRHEGARRGKGWSKAAPCPPTRNGNG